ncbi:TPA: RHS repeat-associated core domain-containing protein [Stenotrophomonas maltophilia]|nr:RHS repeat-associated core domain-containing protein [Stenotrophomonas maltophilia]
MAIARSPDVPAWARSRKSEVFGNQIPSADPDGDGVAVELALRFPGRQATDASGLFYSYQREYDPAVGRYSQSDPIGLKGGISAYAYVDSNPTIATDPKGLAKKRACVAAYIAGCAVCGGAAGYYGGGAVGGISGAAACSPSGPGAAVCAIGGAAGGSALGGASGSVVGEFLGNIVGQAMCPDEEGEDCEALLRTDTDTCNGITRVRGARAGAVCHASATQRYAACLSGSPIPPLNTWSN